MLIKYTTRFLIAFSVLLSLFWALGNSSYNCHNYAWESSENETYRRWLDNPMPYIQAATECAADDATRVVYFDGNTPIHSGLYLGAGWVRSKWGQNPVVVHPVFLSPYGFQVRYYK